MLYDYSRLLGRMRELGKTQEDVATYIGRNLSTLNKKLRGYSFFTQAEISEICDFLSIPPEEVSEYFLSMHFAKHKVCIRLQHMLIIQNWKRRLKTHEQHYHHQQPADYC